MSGSDMRVVHEGKTPDVAEIVIGPCFARTCWIIRAAIAKQEAKVPLRALILATVALALDHQCPKNSCPEKFMS
jgi:hypothetical protein